jgi:dolichyl-phosphate-mannose--protein O-mannosyl transferase
MDREWREAIDLRSSLINVGLVVVSAALLRYWSLRVGFVSAIETEVVRGASQLIRTGSYRPAALTHPMLPLYLHTGVGIVHFLIGAVRGAWRSLADYGPHQLVAWGRGFSALLGTAVVVIVYQIGMRWGARHALLAAGLMAVTPTHVAVSREIGDGSPLVFFSALTLLCSLTAVERGKRTAFIAAGAAAGLAASSHYAGAVILIVPLIAGWMTISDESSRLSRAAWILIAALAAFVVTTPLSVRDLPAFLDGFAAAASPSSAGSSAGAAGALELMRQLMRSFEWPGVILVLAGVALAIVRAITGPGHAR